MNISIPQLLELLTYNGTLDGVSLINHRWLVDILNEESPDNGLFHIEWYTDEHPILWTHNGWIEECRRRKSLDECSKAPLKKVPAAKLQEVTEQNLLRRALLSGDVKEALRIKLLMKGSK